MRKMFGALALAGLVAAGCANQADTTAHSGSGGSAAMVIKISMTDNKFEPAKVTVPRGRRVTFRFTNEGSVKHEALVGDADAQDEHAREMMSSSTMMSGSMDPGDMMGDSSMPSSTMMDSGDMGGMQHSGADSAVTVDPGDSADVTTTFDKAGDYVIGCHQPGHYEAGMKAMVNVTD